MVQPCYFTSCEIFPPKLILQWEFITLLACFRGFCKLLMLYTSISYQLQHPELNIPNYRFSIILECIFVYSLVKVIVKVQLWCRWLYRYLYR